MGTTEIYLNITFRFSQCSSNPACTNDFVTLHRFDTNAIEPISRQNDSANYYIPLFGPGTETTDSRLQQVGTTDVGVVRSFETPGNYAGFYLGIQDTGTCGQVKRIFLYYTPCKELLDGLVYYPELVRPPAGSPNPNIAEACCAPNAHSTTSLTFRAFSDGRCERDVICECDAGYEIGGNRMECIGMLIIFIRTPLRFLYQSMNPTISVHARLFVMCCNSYILQTYTCEVLYYLGKTCWEVESILCNKKDNILYIYVYTACI